MRGVFSQRERSNESAEVILSPSSGARVQIKARSRAGVRFLGGWCVGVGRGGVVVRRLVPVEPGGAGSVLPSFVAPLVFGPGTALQRQRLLGLRGQPHERVLLERRN